MSAIGATFARGALARGALGLVFAIAAFALVWLIETVPLASDPVPAPTMAAAPAAMRELDVESTYAVTADGWSVSVAGKAATPRRSDDASWSGATAGGEIVITAAPVDTADGRLHALRARCDGREQVAWGVGAVTLVVPP